MIFKIKKKVFGFDRESFILHEHITQFAAMDKIRATIVAVYMRKLSLSNFHFTLYFL